MPWTKKRFSETGTEIKSEKFNQDEINELKKLLPFNKTKDLSVKYNCSISLLNHISWYYGIKKDIEFKNNTKKEILISRNKSMGRDMSDELVIEIAKKYETKQEFYIKDSSAYCYANRNNIMQECSKHMVNSYFSIPQLILRDITEYLFETKCTYNNRKIIKPYEIDVYYNKYKIGFEYDGKGWHLESKVDQNEVCEKIKVTLITIKENNRRYLEDIKTQLIDNLNIINNITNLNLTKEKIIHYNENVKIPKLFTDEELILLRKNDKSFLIKNYKNLYKRYRKYNPDNIIFTNKKWEFEIVDKELSKYEKWSDVYKNDKKLYQVTMRKFKGLRNKHFNK